MPHLSSTRPFCHFARDCKSGSSDPDPQYVPEDNEDDDDSTSSEDDVELASGDREVVEASVADTTPSAPPPVQAVPDPPPSKEPNPTGDGTTEPRVNMSCRPFRVSDFKWIQRFSVQSCQRLLDLGYSADSHVFKETYTLPGDKLACKHCIVDFGTKL